LLWHAPRQERSWLSEGARSHVTRVTPARKPARELRGPPACRRPGTYAGNVIFYGVVSAQTERVVEFFLEELPQRLDSPLLFPALRGGYMNLHNWRSREWKPAVRAAGIEPARRIYDLRHSYATMSLAAGVSLFTLARRMGTSVAMIDATYGNLAPDAEDYERGLLDAYDAKTQAFGQLSGTDGDW
jgi:integrase